MLRTARQRFVARHLNTCAGVLALFALLATRACAQQLTPGTEKGARIPKNTAAKLAPASPQMLFGTLVIGTRAVEARHEVETAIDLYENAQYPASIAHAKKATDKDANFALAYAVWSYSARWITAAPEALQKARTLMLKSPGDENLLVKFMTGTQQADVLPAISAMNDLLAKHPKDKHVLYLSGEWLFFQQDYARGRQLMEASLEQDPDFPAALNTLGYAYVESLEPDPAKGINYLRRYAAALPNDPNPQDSIGEVLRMSGDDAGSLAHYAEALQISPSYISSQYGRGDTYTLMGDFTQARAEYEKALQIAQTSHDRLHVEFQKALMLFWAGNPGAGRARLEALSSQAADRKDALAQFEIDFAQALLAPDLTAETEMLEQLTRRLMNTNGDILDAERNEEYATVLREQVRVALAAKKTQDAETGIQSLERLAANSRNLKVENIYESARGMLMCAGGDYADAVDELSQDLHSPLVVQQLIFAQEKLANAAGLEKAHKRLQYLRTPTAEWYLVSQKARVSAQNVAP